MKQVMRHSFSTGTATVALGVVAIVVGGARTLHFLLSMHTYAKLTPLQIIVLLVLPHVLMLTGAGLVISGIIIVGRRLVVAMRMAHAADDLDEPDEPDEEALEEGRT